MFGVSVVVACSLFGLARLTSTMDLCSALKPVSRRGRAKPTSKWRSRGRGFSLSRSCFNDQCSVIVTNNALGDMPKMWSCLRNASSTDTTSFVASEVFQRKPRGHRYLSRLPRRNRETHTTEETIARAVLLSRGQ